MKGWINAEWMNKEKERIEWIKNERGINEWRIREE